MQTKQQGMQTIIWKCSDLAEVGWESETEVKIPCVRKEDWFYKMVINIVLIAAVKK